MSRQKEELTKEIKDIFDGGFVTTEGDGFKIDGHIYGQDYFRLGLALIELSEIRMAQAMKRTQKLLYEATFREDMGK